MIWLSVLLLLCVNQSIETATKCDDSCTIKTYGLSSKLTSCTSDCPVMAKISVIEKDHFDEYLNFTLIGYNVGESEEISIGLQLKKGSSSTDYTCTKFVSGLTRSEVIGYNGIQIIGSSIYLNGNLYCTWVFSKLDNRIWPFDGNKPADLIEDSNYQVSMKVNTSTIIVSSNSTQLPIYMRQYTKCCGYTVRGNKKYSLIAKQNKDSTDFLLQVSGQIPKVARVSLTKANDILTTECNFDESMVSGMVTFNGKPSFLSDPLPNIKIFDHRCSWTLPGTVKYTSGQLETKKGLFNLQIFVDQTVVYNETKVNLSGFSFPTSSNCMIIMISIALSFLLR